MRIGSFFRNRIAFSRNLAAITLLAAVLMSTITFPVRAGVIPPLGPIGDDYNYTSIDPDTAKWTVIQEAEFGNDPSRPPPCTPLQNECHDMWVDNPPGYPFSENKPCDDATTCELDARLVSKQALNYDTTQGLNMLLRERFSPNIKSIVLCGTLILGHGYRMMHVLSLQYPDDPATPIHENDFVLWLVVHHDCNVDGWKFYLSSRYSDADGNFHDFEPFSDCVINPNDWLDLSIEVRDNGRNTLLKVYDETTGVTYSKSITSWIGTRSLPVEIAVQYRHNERSRTDFVDFRLTQNDCGSVTDAGDSFGSAMTIPLVMWNSIRIGACDGSLKYGPDNEDWYRFPVVGGQTILITLSNPSSGPILELWNPNSSFWTNCNSCSAGTWMSGDYRIRILTTGWSGTYSFSVSIRDPFEGGGCSCKMT